ncbi:zinc-ribbon and DUF3426 domain-containing protein [Parendozoicomonas sp. Alg238-R29]|uniref:zinc-ribbon and DUF3426 domain-containing protein n=1 Tax=Parendozoicomonas sp. Alg238-R29 TaxID=2993446 RepID=UPI00248ED19D|nr:zinc-ribbon and DUF3426 domain-containing protein [Parendozoicomonas sp. Alg238-R29]
MQATTHDHDSVESWITRCPECSTAFRITRRHLMAAKGSVRCGSCLHVFKAAHYIVGSELPESLQFQTSPAPEFETQTTRSSLDFSDDAFSIEPSESFGEHSSSDQESSSDDEAWAKAMLEEMDLEEDGPETSEQSATLPEAQDSPKQKNEDSTREKAPDKSIASKAGVTEKAQTTKQAANKLSSLKNEPLDLSYEKKSFGAHLLWPAACFVAVLVLLVQFSSAKFSEISRTPALRPLASSICQVLSCQLPDQIDASRIQASHIVLRADQNYQNTLAIDAIITNEADFEQPYPKLIMTLLDANQNILGKRTLSPEQYLSGEAAGALNMPVQQPIHLALKITSPKQPPQSVDFSFTQ